MSAGMEGFDHYTTKHQNGISAERQLEWNG